VTIDSDAVSTASTTIRSVSHGRSTQMVACSRDSTCSARSSPRPVSSMYQPASRTMFSLTIPARASSPDRIRSLASVSCSPWSYGLAASAAEARSMSASTIQTSSDSWSRTPWAASDRADSDCAAVPDRCRSSSRARNSGIISRPLVRKPG
jgi:hypothetical protein